MHRGLDKHRGEEYNLDKAKVYKSLLNELILDCSLKWKEIDSDEEAGEKHWNSMCEDKVEHSPGRLNNVFPLPCKLSIL